jgi:hypothetical protein
MRHNWFKSGETKAVFINRAGMTVSKICDLNMRIVSELI